MELTIIISYYKALDNLKLILEALNKQSNKNFEVIISEDDHNTVTDQFLTDCKDDYSYVILHTNQEQDQGFRKCEMLNKSIRLSATDKLVFIDGDCIPHKHFVKSYLEEIKPGYFYCGRRVMLSDKISSRLKSTKKIERLSFLNLLMSKSKKIKEGIYNPYTKSYKDRGILGCNWGIMKEHLVAINGFDEDYKTASVGEDTDVEWRLRSVGVKMKSIKNRAIVYHIYHEKGYSQEGLLLNLKIMEPKKEANMAICTNGLAKTNKNLNNLVK